MINRQDKQDKYQRRRVKDVDGPQDMIPVMNQYDKQAKQDKQDEYQRRSVLDVDGNDACDE